MSAAQHAHRSRISNEVDRKSWRPCLHAVQNAADRLACLLPCWCCVRLSHRASTTTGLSSSASTATGRPPCRHQPAAPVSRPPGSCPRPLTCHLHMRRPRGRIHHVVCNVCCRERLDALRGSQQRGVQRPATASAASGGSGRQGMRLLRPSLPPPRRARARARHHLVHRIRLVHVPLEAHNGELGLHSACAGQGAATQHHPLHAAAAGGAAQPAPLAAPHAGP